MPGEPESLDTPTGADERSPWPLAVLMGVILGAAVSAVAGILYRLRPGEGRPPRQLPETPPSPALPDRGGPGGATPVAAPALPAGAAPAPKARPGAGTASKPQQPGQPPARPAGPPNWKEPTKYAVGVGLFLAGVVIVYISRSAIPIIILGALLALVVQPVIGFFRRRLKFAKGLAIATTYLLVILLILLIPLVLIPLVIDAANDLINIDYQGWAQNAAQALQNLSATVSRIPVLNVVLDPFLNSLVGGLEDLAAARPPEPVSYQYTMGGLIDQLGQTLGVIAKVAGPIVSAVTSLVFMLLISFHLSLSGRKMLAGFPRLLPPAYVPEITDLFERIQDVWTSFLRGQLALMLIIGVMVWLGNAILGNRYAPILGIISGTLEIIPNLGPALALIPGVGMALLFGSSHFAMSNVTFALIVLVFYLLVQVVENQLIVPYVLGGELEVPPLVVIIGIMVGGAVAGILGVLLAVPIMATGREIFVYLYDKILEPPVEEAPPEKKPSFLDSIGDRVRNLKLPFGRQAKSPPASEELEDVG